MKKTSLLSTILFTLAMAAVNIPVIAQPQNNRLDSLKREYSYKVCKRYLQIEKWRKITHSNYVNDGIKYQIPIVTIFPSYFDIQVSNVILPQYYYFSPAYGCPAYIRAKDNNALSRNRNDLNIITKKIIDMLYSDSIYCKVIESQNDSTISSSEFNKMLIKEEERIKEANLWIYTYTSMIMPRDNNFYANAGKRYRAIQGKQHRSISHTEGTADAEFKYNNYIGYTIDANEAYDIKRTIKVPYTRFYLQSLRQANLASLRVILDDHIRRGVPIDISWIPEQTLAEIEATKPVRQLKKQIKTLEKQQRQ